MVRFRPWAPLIRTKRLTHAVGLFVFCCVFTALFTIHDDASSHAAHSKLCAAALEGWAFYLYWLLALAHAVLYPTQVWRRQLQLAAGLAVGAVLLNWLTTDDHLLRSLSAGHAAVAGMDLMLLALSGVSLLAARRIRRAESAPHRNRRHAPYARGISVSELLASRLAFALCYFAFALLALCQMVHRKAIDPLTYPSPGLPEDPEAVGSLVSGRQHWHC